MTLIAKDLAEITLTDINRSLFAEDFLQQQLIFIESISLEEHTKFNLLRHLVGIGNTGNIGLVIFGVNSEEKQILGLEGTQDNELVLKEMVHDWISTRIQPLITDMIQIRTMPVKENSFIMAIKFIPDKEKVYGIKLPTNTTFGVPVNVYEFWVLDKNALRQIDLPELLGYKVLSAPSHLSTEEQLQSKIKRGFWKLTEIFSVIPPREEMSNVIIEPERLKTLIRFLKTQPKNLFQWFNLNTSIQQVKPQSTQTHMIMELSDREEIELVFNPLDKDKPPIRCRIVVFDQGSAGVYWEIWKGDHPGDGYMARDYKLQLFDMISDFIQQKYALQVDEMDLFDRYFGYVRTIAEKFRMNRDFSEELAAILKEPKLLGLFSRRHVTIKHIKMPHMYLVDIQDGKETFIMDSRSDNHLSIEDIDTHFLRHGSPDFHPPQNADPQAKQRYKNQIRTLNAFLLRCVPEEAQKNIRNWINFKKEEYCDCLINKNWSRLLGMYEHEAYDYQKLFPLTGPADAKTFHLGNSLLTLLPAQNGLVARISNKNQENWDEITEGFSVALYIICDQIREKFSTQGRLLNLPAYSLPPIN